MKKNYLRVVMDTFNKIILPVQIICLYAMVGLMFATVALREMFGIGLSWGYEITAFFAIIVVYLGMPKNEEEKGHLKVGVLYDMTRGISRAVLNVIHYIITLFTIVVMGYSFIRYIGNLGNFKLSASRWPNWVFYGIIGVGVLLTILELITEFINLFVKKNGNSDGAMKKLEELEKQEKINLEEGEGLGWMD